MIKRFLDYLLLERNRSPHTLTAYETDLNGFLTFLNQMMGSEEGKTGNGKTGYRQTGNGNIRSGEPDISPNDRNEYSSGLLINAGSREIREWLAAEAKKGCSPRSLRRKTQGLRSFYNWAVKTGIKEVNPANNIEPAKLPKNLPNFVSPEEMDNISHHRLATDPALEERNHLIVEILYSYGLRQAELRAIRDRDIDLSRGEMKIHGKGGRDRIVPLAPETISKIREWIKLRNAIMSASPIDEKMEKPLITGRGWNPISKSQLQNIVREALTGTKAIRRSPHTLRHSFATAMLNGGADIMTVKEFLGHRSLSSTQIYTHLNFRELQRDYARAHPRGEHNDNSTENKERHK